MIEVKNLMKKYGNHEAVKDVSFIIEDGKIYGLLGPNGAGKSTTMNIITGCLSANEGEIYINGHEIYEEPVKAKKMIGYLPEIPPLYPEMTVGEYLAFVARAKGVKDSALQEEINIIEEKTGLTEVDVKIIDSLSKGYKQRVGIAQAMLGSPKIIILDEPTVGLDPKQIIEIRNLIKELGKEHTVILSSHILSEIQSICDHVIIINEGKIVASDTIDNLVHLFVNENHLKISAKCGEEPMTEILDNIEDVQQYYLTKSGDITEADITVDHNSDIREELFFAFSGAGIPLLKIENDEPSFEEIYLRLTSCDSFTDETDETDEPDSQIADDSTNDSDSIIVSGEDEE